MVNKSITALIKSQTYKIYMNFGTSEIFYAHLTFFVVCTHGQEIRVSYSDTLWQIHQPIKTTNVGNRVDKSWELAQLKDYHKLYWITWTKLGTKFRIHKIYMCLLVRRLREFTVYRLFQPLWKCFFIKWMDHVTKQAVVNFFCICYFKVD